MPWDDRSILSARAAEGTSGLANGNWELREQLCIWQSMLRQHCAGYRLRWHEAYAVYGLQLSPWWLDLNLTRPQNGHAFDIRHRERVFCFVVLVRWGFDMGGVWLFQDVVNASEVFQIFPLDISQFFRHSKGHVGEFFALWFWCVGASLGVWAQKPVFALHVCNLVLRWLAFPPWSCSVHAGFWCSSWRFSWSVSAWCPESSRKWSMPPWRLVGVKKTFDCKILFLVQYSYLSSVLASHQSKKLAFGTCTIITGHVFMSSTCLQRCKMLHEFLCISLQGFLDPTVVCRSSCISPLLFCRLIRKSWTACREHDCLTLTNDRRAD